MFTAAMVAAVLVLVGRRQREIVPERGKDAAAADAHADVDDDGFLC